MCGNNKIVIIWFFPFRLIFFFLFHFMSVQRHVAHCACVINQFTTWLKVKVRAKREEWTSGCKEQTYTENLHARWLWKEDKACPSQNIKSIFMPHFIFFLFVSLLPIQWMCKCVLVWCDGDKFMLYVQEVIALVKQWMFGKLKNAFSTNGMLKAYWNLWETKPLNLNCECCDGRRRHHW